MDLTLTEDQRLLASGVRGLLADVCTPQRIRDTWEAGRPDPDRWAALAELGVVAATVPADHGGLGLDERDLVPLLVETGRAALPEPVIETVAVAGPLLADVGGALAADVLPRIATGSLIVVPVLASDPYPAWAGAADLLLVQRGDAIHAVTLDEVTVTAQPNVDGGRPTASVSGPADDRPPDVVGVGAALARAAARGSSAAAAQLLGAGRAALDLAVTYARTREQFGRPIGSFQAVKHLLASAVVELEFARPLVDRAAWASATGAPDAARHAGLAKAVSGEAAAQAVAAAIQVHGAIGYTWESDLHLWSKRVWSLAAAWTDTESCWQRVEAALLPHA